MNRIFREKNFIGTYDMKSIFIPCSGPVEIEGLQPVIDHPLFQRLRKTSQLGLNSLIFPGAQHTRLEHALGVLSRTRKACQIQKLSPSTTRTLELFALLHDIGHGPFSHQIEPVLTSDHHQNGLKCLMAMRDAILACGGNPQELCKMLSGEETEFSQIVTDRNLGADKLDYLQRDAFHIGFSGLPDIEVIQQQTLRLQDGHLALHEKFIEEGKRLQKFYSYLHQHGYLNKTALTAQRILQRALHEEMRANPLDDSIIWGMTDAELMTYLGNSKLKLVKEYIELLKKRELFKTCLCIKPEGYKYVENTLGKAITTVTWNRSNLSRFSQKVSSMEKLREVEDSLADAAGLPHGQLILAAMPYFTKLLPRDLLIANGGNNHDYWLFDQDRDHKASLESDYLRTFSIRVAVPEEKRSSIAAKADTLLNILSGV